MTELYRFNRQTKEHEGRRYSRDLEQKAMAGVVFEDDARACRPEALLRGLPPISPYLRSTGVSRVYETCGSWQPSVGPGFSANDNVIMTKKRAKNFG